jgi:hypothetical protein
VITEQDFFGQIFLFTVQKMARLFQFFTLVIVGLAMLMAVVTAEDLFTPCKESQRGAVMCPMIYMPVCGNDSHTYGNSCEACRNAQVTGYVSGQCAAATTATPAGATKCLPEQRNAEICPMLYHAVCGSDGQTYPSPCQACSNTAVASFTDGECVALANTCTAEQRQGDMCTMIYMPVCGDDGNTYSNSCHACHNPQVNTYQSGPCAADA